jgi:hypothetical protein
MTDLWGVAPSSLVEIGGRFRGIIVLMMEAVSIFETSVSFYRVMRCSVPEHSHVLSTKMFVDCYKIEQKSRSFHL